MYCNAGYEMCLKPGLTYEYCKNSLGTPNAIILGYAVFGLTVSGFLANCFTDNKRLTSEKAMIIATTAVCCGLLVMSGLAKQSLAIRECLNDFQFCPHVNPY